MPTNLSIVICTFQRPDQLQQLLSDLEPQMPSHPDIEVIVVDNDRSASAQEATSKPTISQLKYVVEQQQNISAARNRGLSEASAPAVLFLDDDQRVHPTFLQDLLVAIEKHEPWEALRLPVIPTFSHAAPLDFHQAKLFGFKSTFAKGVLSRDHMGTGGLVLKKEPLGPEPFRQQLGLSGGEDTDLFSRFANEKWFSLDCPKVIETVPLERMNRHYLRRLWRRKGQTDIHQDLAQWNLAKRMYHILRAAILYVLATTTSTFTFGKRALWCSCLASRQLGKLDGLFGRELLEFYRPKKRRPINVLHVTQHMQLGGAEKLIEQIASGHKDPQIKLSFLFYNAVTDTPLMQSLERYRHPIVKYCKSKGIDLGILQKLKETVKRYDIDVIHCHDIGGLIYAMAFKVMHPRLKLVHTVHTLHNWTNHSRYKVVYKLACYMADRTICVASHVRDTLGAIAGGTLRKAVIVNNGVDLTRFCYSPSRKGHTIVSVSRISPEKNLIALMHAYSELSRRQLTFVAKHLGDGPTTEVGLIEQKISELKLSDHVEMLGYRNDVAEHVRKADIFVTASKEECTPVSVLEAMAMGKICVCSDIPAHKELPKGSVVLFSTDDHLDLAGKLASLLEENIPQDDMRRTARQVVEESYSLTAMITAYNKIYCSIVAH